MPLDASDCELISCKKASPAGPEVAPTRFGLRPLLGSGAASQVGKPGPDRVARQSRVDLGAARGPWAGDTICSKPSGAGPVTGRMLRRRTPAKASRALPPASGARARPR